jgi:hypothetical protein
VGLNFYRVALAFQGGKVLINDKAFVFSNSPLISRQWNDKEMQQWKFNGHESQVTKYPERVYHATSSTVRRKTQRNV